MDYLLHHRIIVWTEMAGQLLRESLKRNLLVEEKLNARDLVTEMDRKIESFLVNKIRENYPNHRVIGEEGTGESIQDTKGILWVIDPIDGTMNFVKQKNHFGIMIGIFEDGLPLAGYIFDVMAEDLYYGIIGDGAYVNHIPLKPYNLSGLNQSLISVNPMNFSESSDKLQKISDTSLGIRYYGSAALEIIGVLRGELGAYVSTGLHPWDFAAGYAICQALGFTVTNFEGKSLDILERSTAVFARPQIHQEILSLLN